MRSTFINSLIKQARVDDRIFLLTGDLGFSVLENFENEFPDRFLNVGIAEQNMVSVAAGLALSGKIVYVYSIIPFLTMRCFEQIRVDLAYMNTNVRLIGVGAGLSYGPAGSTHHSIEDIAIMRALPNMTICCPGDPIEAHSIIEQSYNHRGPMYIRLGKNGEPAIHKENAKIIIGKANYIQKGKKIAMITTSNMLEEANNIIQELNNKNIIISLISMHTIKPLDKKIILDLLKINTSIITLEEHNIIGGLGSAVAEIIAESGSAILFKRIGINDAYIHDIGSQKYLRDKLNLKNKTQQTILQFMNEK